MRLNLDFVKKRREELRLSPTYMAEALGFANASTYWKYESGNYRLRADMLAKLADILKCEPQNFFVADSSKIEN